MKKICLNILILLIYLTSYIVCYEIDIDQFKLCYDTRPEKVNDCIYRDNTTLVCCYVSLVLPQQGASCMPMTLVNKYYINESKSFQNTIFGTSFQGEYYCNRTSLSNFLRFTSINILIILMMFII